MATFDPSSREREAHAEIVATRVAPRTARALVATALAFAALGLGLELAALARGASSLSETWAPPAAAPGLPALAWNREAVARLREIDDRVDQRSALARALRPWGQVALTALARYGNEEAYVGRRDWLVYRPDFDHLTGREYLDRRPGEDPVTAIAAFAADLERRGIALLLLPVPAKPAVHPESLAWAPSEEAPHNVDDPAFTGRLREHGVGMLDPLGLLRRAALDEPAYLATDTHWRPAAMDQVARETAIRLRALVDLPVGDDAALREEPGRVEGVGDTAALLELPAGVRRFAPERVETRRVIRADGTPWRAERAPRCFCSATASRPSTLRPSSVSAPAPASPSGSPSISGCRWIGSCATPAAPRTRARRSPGSSPAIRAGSTACAWSSGSSPRASSRRATGGPSRCRPRPPPPGTLPIPPPGRTERSRDRNSA